MNVTNDGNRITIDASFEQAALFAEALRRTIPEYDAAGLTDFADESRKMLDKLANGQRLK